MNQLFRLVQVLRPGLDLIYIESPKTNISPNWLAMVKTAASALILTLEARAIDLDNIVDILLRKENTVNLCFQFYNFFVLGQW